MLSKSIKLPEDKEALCLGPSETGLCWTEFSLWLTLVAPFPHRTTAIRVAPVNVEVVSETRETLHSYALIPELHVRNIKVCARACTGRVWRISY